MTRALGVDVGSKRVGIAVSDPLGMTARPLEVVARARAVDRIVELVSEMGVGRLVVGIPRPLSGGESESSRMAESFAGEIRERTGVETVLVDERFTTKMAEEAMLSAGLKRRDRRDRVDKVAAAIFLQDFLDGNFDIVGDVEETGPQ